MSPRKDFDGWRDDVQWGDARHVAARLTKPSRTRTCAHCGRERALPYFPKHEWFGTETATCLDCRHHEGTAA